MEYKGKLLLFGEHIVVRGAQALAMPLQQFSGYWKFIMPAQLPPSMPLHLYEWFSYLSAEQKSETLGCHLDLPRLKHDLDLGLFFESNIPVGYGAGSSGALCAALYDVYAQDTIDRADTASYHTLKAILGNLESFFHGASSGADPLVSYVDQPLLFDHTKAISPVHLPPPHPQYSLFLLDTHRARKTEPMVHAFRSWCSDPAYLARVISELIPATEDAIQYFLNGAWDMLFEEWGAISHFQYRYMQEMILPEWRSVWLESLGGQTQRLKLCGAGGGGFILGISSDWEKTQAVFGNLVSQVTWK